MLHPDITWLTSAVTASVFANRVPRKDAHRGGSLPNTSGSRLPTWVRDGLVTRRRLTSKAERRKGPLCLRSQLDIALNRHHRLVEVSRPALRRSPCALPRVQRGVECINTIRQRSNCRLLLASYTIGSLHGDRPRWLYSRHRRVWIIFGWQCTEPPHQIGV